MSLGTMQYTQTFASTGCIMISTVAAYCLYAVCDCHVQLQCFSDIQDRYRNNVQFNSLASYSGSPQFQLNYVQ